ncbi:MULTISPECIES: hypothetical protein [Paenibacillus]|uniref:hypothetical protein n=1 Tax=Paenibacillus TaxID=44249 RepID=UPI000F535C5A|nr:hypothetical protein [Paenibacillus xylanexedens]RPK20132.1 hypothetical protein EDO6_06671 [Paenibacillus xylanexedens]
MKVNAYVVCVSGVYPVSYSKQQIDEISTLERGDILKIKGIGELKITDFQFKRIGSGEAEECNVYIKAKSIWEI